MSVSWPAAETRCPGGTLEPLVMGIKGVYTKNYVDFSRRVVQ